MHATTPAHSYKLCGWHTRSDVPLTGLQTLACGSDDAEIIIQIVPGSSPIAKDAGRFVFEHSAERSFIRIENVADFEIADGRRIRLWPAEGADLKDIEIFLFGPAWATLCHQRGLLPLHASAIRTGRGIAAFAGNSGAGKSTTAALMVAMGYELATDDVLPISFNRDSGPGAWPYLRRFKLQGAPIAELALTPSEIVSERLDKRKYFVGPKRAAPDAWNRLYRIYLLEPDDTLSCPSIHRISGAEATRALVDQTYHFSFILKSRRFRHHLEQCAQVATETAIYSLRIPHSYGIGEKLGRFISTHLESAPA